jgi:PilZ domain
MSNRANTDHNACVVRDNGRDNESDRRLQPRAKTDLFVNRFLNGHPYLCRMTDLSRGGARLVAINEPRLNPTPKFMGLQFQLPGRPEIVTASGETVTTDGGQVVGIRFTRLTPAAAAAIDALVQLA